MIDGSPHRVMVCVTEAMEELLQARMGSRSCLWDTRSCTTEWAQRKLVALVQHTLFQPRRDEALQLTWPVKTAHTLQCGWELLSGGYALCT